MEPLKSSLFLTVLLVPSTALDARICAAPALSQRLQVCAGLHVGVACVF